MKSGWKWSFAALTILIIVSAAQVFFTAAAFVFVFPWITEICQMLDIPLPSRVAGILRVALVVKAETPLVLFAALTFVAVAWALFEWRCKTENKPLIRLTTAAFVTLVTTAAFCITAIVTFIPMLELAQSARWRNPVPSLRRRLAAVDQTFVSFRDAVASGNSREMGNTANYFTYVLNDLQAPGDLTALVSLRHDGELAQLRTAIDSLSAQALAVRLDNRPEDMDALADTWSRFCADVGYISLMTAPSAEEPQPDDSSGGVDSVDP